MTAVVGDAAVGAAEWQLCAHCRSLVYRKRLQRNRSVCPECGRHERLTARERVRQLFDAGSATPLDFQVDPGDPLGFVDTRPYPERIRSAQRKTGLAEAVLCVRGTIGGSPLVAAVMDFDFMGGSLGTAVGELVTRAAEHALDRRIPLLLVTASGGARMQEGALALMQMAKTSQALAELDEAGILTVSLITDPTFGGVAASYATLCDVIVIEPGARLGFAGPRVIEQTIGHVLPTGLQTAEFLLDHGMVDMVCPRAALPATLARILSFGVRDRAERPSGARTAPLVHDGGELAAGSPWETVQQARDPHRPTTLDYIHAMLEDFEELHGDRLASDCTSVVGGLGRLDDVPLVVIGNQKGHTATELAACNFGMATPAGYRKAARLMRLAAKLRLPLLTLVDTPGAYPGPEAEEQGQAVAIADSLRIMTRLPVPVVAVVTGEGGSGGALAIAVANRVLAFSNAVYSVISPEGCAAILWKDAAQAPRAAEALRLETRHLLALGIIDGVIPEPEGGAQADPALAAERLGHAVKSTLDELSGLDARQLIAERRLRFRSFGTLPPA
ncbi:acetyl-CoA carboxylase carboxyltransferase subunit alpha [Micromonospora sp. NPDC047548]|uniref:acetyl-CoA carboxylase carboxyltransferase subunit alpha n=1 Tax=Micromonospora sp. NPDC047548 TaxID=3155624 RepID=UPI00340BB9E8